MAQAAEKLSISMPHELAVAARKGAGRCGLSSFVAWPLLANWNVKRSANSWTNSTRLRARSRSRHASREAGLAEAPILDAEALNALANPTQRGALALRARAIACDLVHDSEPED